ncbi:MAG: PEP-CTERM sorting domain-containing protein [Synechococcales cyanobacterium CRU_2_2]|nr:PEP-CTERM sorting domain-containing protein [Synechococcales cyanobacterium CRU_2_2]
MPVVSALQNSSLLTALQILNVPELLNNADSATAAILNRPIVDVLADEKPNDFFKIGFNAGPLNTYIESITFDLSSDPDAAFDSQDFFRYEALPKVGMTQGLSASDISFSAVTRNDDDNPNPTRLLKINFAQGSFGLGDFFSFGVDTNGVGSDVIAALAQLNSLTNDKLSTFNDTGADFGRAGIKFAVKLENGKSGEGTFGVVNPVASAARVNIDNPTSVPEPGTVAGLLLLGAMSATRRRQRQG